MKYVPTLDVNLKKNAYLRLKENLYVRGNTNTESTHTEVLMVV